MTLADDGGVVVLGNTRNEGPGSWSVLLWKVSSQGAEEWSTIFGGTKRDRGRRVIRVKPEGYLVCGNTKSFNSNEDIFLSKVGPTGAIEWSIAVGDGSANDYCQGIGQSSDGQWLYFGGYSQGLNTPNN